MIYLQIILFLLPSLINCQMDTLQEMCGSIICPSYKSNKIACNHIHHIADPFTNECVSKCDSPCVDGLCDFCICQSSDEDVIKSTYLPKCKRVYRNTSCSEVGCELIMPKSCNSNYVHNPYSNLECLLRCDEDSCGKGGTCSAAGHCVCHLGYRPDPANLRICLKIPEDNTTKLERTCHKGFKLSVDGECVSTCGDCKNGCCGTDGVCHCWNDYELDVATSTCVTKRSCSERCLNGICDSDGVCQCPDCSDVINKTVICRAGQNDAVDDVGGLDADYNCGNTSSSEDMISKTKHKTSIAILLCITTILLIATIILTFIVLKMNRALPINEGKVKILFGGLGELVLNP